MSKLTGGCQCGAVRFACSGLGEASICHCRMCQKASGQAFSALAVAQELIWTRGAPKTFRSSNRAVRGFCGDCGTPLSYQADGGTIEIAIGALDDPKAAPPHLQLAMESRLPWCDNLPALPTRSAAEQAKRAAFYAGIVSHQHPDHDTRDWTPRS